MYTNFLVWDVDKLPRPHCLPVNGPVRKMKNIKSNPTVQFMVKLYTVKIQPQLPIHKIKMDLKCITQQYMLLTVKVNIKREKSDLNLSILKKKKHFWTSANQNSLVSLPVITKVKRVSKLTSLAILSSSLSFSSSVADD